MQGIGNGIEHHPGTAKYTGTLTDRSGNTLFTAGHFKFFDLTFLVNLRFSFI
jgi:hypothetical protein